jgi:uncharacterized protein YecE (DUF72 family)
MRSAHEGEFEQRQGALMDGARHATVHVGTSGWTYEHWKNRFYPGHLPKTQWLEYYCQHFSTVEINASFYRIPRPVVVSGWQGRTPQDFLFSIKASRLITHVKKLKNCQKEIEWFFTTFGGMEKKIGAYLLQLPPTLKFDAARLSDFIAQLPTSRPLVFEFRNREWLTDATYRLLEDHKAFFCIGDLPDLTTDRVVTGKLAYVRFHGYQAQYGGCYPDEVLYHWADWILTQHRRGVTVFAYFNNDRDGFAVQNSLKLKQLLHQG